MSTKKKLLEAAAGNAGEAVYVDDVFSTYLRSGTGAGTSFSVSNDIDLAGEGGLVWYKRRTGTATDHILIDSERGAGYVLESNTTDYSRNRGWFTSFNSDGFSGDGQGNTNDSGEDYVSWTFRKQPGFFDIVTYTGDGSASPRQIAHNLGSVPGFIIIKRTDSTSDWTVWHRSVTGNAFLQTTDAWQSGYSRITTPSSTTFTVGDSSMVNASGGTFVAYLFAHNDGDGEFGETGDQDVIKCGSYTGTGSDLSINLGFEPQWILFKKTNGATDWVIRDNMRGTTDNFRSELYPNLSDAEYNHTSGPVVFTPTGFRLPVSNGYYNTSGDTFIYVAIRRPHKPASELAATDLFAVNNGDGFTVPGFTSGFPVDMAWERRSNEIDDTQLSTRLLGETALKTNSNAAEASAGLRSFDYMNGWLGFAEGTDWYSWMFRRAPGFFDVVTYTGTGSFFWLNHNLGVVPEMVWFKGRDYATHWTVFTTQGGTSSHLILNDTEGNSTTGQNALWTNLPTETQFRVGSDIEINGSGYDYVAYFFASVPGISKVGSYTGTAADLNVDCGFSAGARLILIKRTDSAGDWYLWDSLRGIVAGNDPYLLLNSTAAEVTSTDYIDPLSSGFTVTSTAPAALNASGGTYIFYAIA